MSTKCLGRSRAITIGIFGPADRCVLILMVLTRPPHFWSFGNKMADYLLGLAGRAEGRGIRPNSLEVATISALMADVVSE